MIRLHGVCVCVCIASRVCGVKVHYCSVIYIGPLILILFFVIFILIIFFFIPCVILVLLILVLLILVLTVFLLLTLLALRARLSGRGRNSSLIHAHLLWMLLRAH